MKIYPKIFLLCFQKLTPVDHVPEKGKRHVGALPARRKEEF
jgi:hypothetical protein